MPYTLKHSDTGQELRTRLCMQFAKPLTPAWLLLVSCPAAVCFGFQSAPVVSFRVEPSQLLLMLLACLWRCAISLQAGNQPGGGLPCRRLGGVGIQRLCLLLLLLSTLLLLLGWAAVGKLPAPALGVGTGAGGAAAAAAALSLLALLLLPAPGPGQGDGMHQVGSGGSR